MNGADNGRLCMERLAITALGAMQKAGMMEHVNMRVFGRSPDELVEWTTAESGNAECRYRPMVELLLIELAAIGDDTRVDLVEQQRRIEWTLDIAGF